MNTGEIKTNITNQIKILKLLMVSFCNETLKQMDADNIIPLKPERLYVDNVKPMYENYATQGDTRNSRENISKLLRVNLDSVRRVSNSAELMLRAYEKTIKHRDPAADHEKQDLVFEMILRRCTRALLCEKNYLSNGESIEFAIKEKAVRDEIRQINYGNHADEHISAEDDIIGKIERHINEISTVSVSEPGRKAQSGLLAGALGKANELITERMQKTADTFNNKNPNKKGMDKAIETALQGEQSAVELKKFVITFRDAYDDITRKQRNIAEPRSTDVKALNDMDVFFDRLMTDTITAKKTLMKMKYFTSAKSEINSDIIERRD